jgi:hypothetical protein
VNEQYDTAVVFKGIENLEWAVLPPLSKMAAAPLDATANAISPVRLTASNIALNRNVLPVPPGPSTKKMLL